MSKELIGIFEVGDNSEGLCGCGCGEDLSNYNAYAGKILSHLTDEESDRWADSLAGSIVESVRRSPKIGLWIRCTGEPYGCGGWYNVDASGDCVLPDDETDEELLLIAADPFWIKVEQLATGDKKSRSKARKLMKEKGAQYGKA